MIGVIRSRLDYGILDRKKLKINCRFYKGMCVLKFLEIFPTVSLVIGLCFIFTKR